MNLPLVPFEGRMSYCLIKCIQMVLANKGQDYPLPWLECVSGEPFGFVYVRDGKSLFAITGYGYHLAGEHLLRTLNYDYTFTGAVDGTEALAALDEALTEGPAIAGMLDMGYLTYMPNHQVLHGSDHAIVVLARTPDAVVVHDPDGYPATPLPLADFLEAWKRDIYTEKPYGLWRIGAQGTPPTTETIWEKTLARVRENLALTEKSYPGGTTLLYGPNGMRALATDLRAAPEQSLGSLPYFNWRVSGQRCLDGAVFLRELLPEAAAIRWEECQLYGMLQQASAAEDASEHARLPELLERLADLETRFIAALV
ncbi:MAG TPA: BtrH N-terminal domain-containing protein [Ktedonobacterales bacterium]|nr:BtrH N-terminal domain-containing protein [Ktedonobacterales bacterium]